jgi:hypothetical protein
MQHEFVLSEFPLSAREKALENKRSRTDEIS